MWRERQTRLLEDELSNILTSLSGETSLHKLAEESLGIGERSASPDGCDRPWLLLPLIVCQAISSQYERALPAAAALVLFKAAAEIFDDIEDRDNPDSFGIKIGVATAINLATALLMLAEKAIIRLKLKGIADQIIIRVTETINSYYTSICIGQHLDLCLNHNLDLSEQTYLEIVKQKSSLNVECACFVGALIGGSNQKLLDLFALFGQNIGMASQIANDIQGIIHGNDIIQRQITLPIIYGLTQTEEGIRDRLLFMFQERTTTVDDCSSIRDLLFQHGAIYYAITKLEYYKQIARDILFKIESVGINTNRLRYFLK